MVLLKRVLLWASRHPVLTALLPFVAAVLLGGAVFSMIEGGSYLDGVWWAFISSTTVGYGDLSPKTPGVRFVAFVVIAAGIFAVTVIGAWLTSKLVVVRLEHQHDEPGLEDDFDRVLGLVEGLKNRYMEEESGDEVVEVRARELVALYRSGELTDNGNGLRPEGRRMLESLDEALRHEERVDA